MSGVVLFWAHLQFSIVSYIWVLNVGHLTIMDRPRIDVAMERISCSAILQMCLLFPCHVRNPIVVLNTLQLGVRVLDKQAYMHCVSWYRLTILKYLYRERYWSSQSMAK
jgi:hypothetical protein